MRDTFNITREKSISCQIESAIQLYFSKNYLSSLTLAAAAEDATPNTEKPHLYLLAKQTGEEKGLKKVHDMINGTKNWLKHWDETKPQEINFDTIETVFMITRAITKYSAYYPKSYELQKFEHFISHIKEHLDFKKILSQSYTDQVN